MLMAPMTILAETPRTAAFDANRDANLALVAELRDRLALVQRGGGDEAVVRHTGAASCSPGIASTASSIPAPRSSSCRRSPPGTCTRARRPGPGS